MTYIQVFLLIGLLTFRSFAADDCLAKRPLVIGCSYDCDSFYGFALRKNAARLGHKIITVNLSKESRDLSTLDGILIPGGADIDPKYYLESVPADLASYTRDHLPLVNFSEEGRRRDPLEYNLVKEYVEDDRLKSTPLLGICRGMQMMAVASGLPLYVDIKHELGFANRYNKLDLVRISKGDSLASKFYPSGRTLGVKYHHQGIRVDYFKENAEKFPDLKITGYSHKEKIAEVLEFGHRPALGVQYHPEKALTRGNGRPIWKWFLTRACERSNL